MIVNKENKANLNRILVYISIKLYIYLSHTKADPITAWPHILKNELYKKYNPMNIYIKYFSIFFSERLVIIPAIIIGETNLNKTDNLDHISKSPLLLKINNIYDMNVNQYMILYCPSFWVKSNPYLIIIQVVINDIIEENRDAVPDTYPNLSDKLLSLENQKSAFSKYELILDESAIEIVDSNLFTDSRYDGFQK